MKEKASNPVNRTWSIEWFPSAKYLKKIFYFIEMQEGIELALYRDYRVLREFQSKES